MQLDAVKLGTESWLSYSMWCITPKIVSDKSINDFDLFGPLASPLAQIVSIRFECYIRNMIPNELGLIK